MSKILQLVSLILMLGFMGCGGGSSSQGESPVGVANSVLKFEKDKVDVNVTDGEKDVITLKAVGTSSGIVYGLSGDDRNYFEIDAYSGKVTFKEPPKYDTKSTYTFIAVAKKTFYDDAKQVITVYIQKKETTNSIGSGGSEYNSSNNTIDDNTAPTFTSSSSVSVNENQTTAITLRATDSNSITYSISGTDAGYFTVNSSTGVVTFRNAPDYESKNSYAFTAKATDSKGNTQSQTVQIYIIDVLEDIASSISSVSPLSINLDENTLFNIYGSNLPFTLVSVIPNCMYMENLGGNDSHKQFSCTPTGTAGTENGLIKDKAGGVILDTFTVSIQKISFKLSLLKGVWNKDSFYYYFLDNGSYTLYNYQNSCYTKQIGNQFKKGSDDNYYLYKDGILLDIPSTFEINNNVWTITNNSNGDSLDLNRLDLDITVFESNLCN